MLVSFNYHNRNSLIEKIDPRARWIYSILILFAVTLFWDIRFLLFFLALNLGQYYLARLTWKETRRAWGFIFFIMSMMVIVNTLITSAGTIREVMQGGHPIVAISIPIFGWSLDFTLTIERLWFALTQVVRILAISALFLVIPFTMDPRQYGATFRGLGLPDRLAYSLDLAFRFVPTLGRDFQLTLDAQRARGYEVEKLDGGLFAQIRKMAPLVVPVTMNAILSGEDITNAMDLRCFGLHRRTWIEQLKYRRLDYFVIGLGALLLVASIVLNVLGYGDFWLPPALLS
ncbi:MAG: energy-coupling factor transporter transmembrane component T [Anaerolineales bacterium]|nr:energy-coupling factor transporter transmembrane component T [Anaerolineales bacterium]